MADKPIDCIGKIYDTVNNYYVKLLLMRLRCQFESVTVSNIKLISSQRIKLINSIRIFFTKVITKS